VQAVRSVIFDSRQRSCGPSWRCSVRPQNCVCATWMFWSTLRGLTGGNAQACGRGGARGTTKRTEVAHRQRLVIHRDGGIIWHVLDDVKSDVAEISFVRNAITAPKLRFLPSPKISYAKPTRGPTVPQLGLQSSPIGLIGATCTEPFCTCWKYEDPGP